MKILLSGVISHSHTPWYYHIIFIGFGDARRLKYSSDQEGTNPTVGLFELIVGSDINIFGVDEFLPF